MYAWLQTYIPCKTQSSIYATLPIEFNLSQVQLYKHYGKWNRDLKKLKSLTIVHHSRGFCCLSPSHWKHKSIYLPAISFLFYMMKDVYHITDSSWVFFNFCSKKDTCHSINLKYNFRKKGRFGICIKPADKTLICPSLKQV